MKLFLRFLVAAWAILPCAAAFARVPALRCEGCDAQAMRGRALGLPGTGLRFVYSYDSHAIRKYEVWLDTANLAGPGTPEEAAVASTPGEGMASAVPVPSGATREIEELPVDAAMGALFVELDALHAAQPELVEFGRTRLDITRLGESMWTDHGLSYFDPRQIAWDFNDAHPSLSGQAYLDFIQRVRDEGAVRYPELGKFLELTIRAQGLTIQGSRAGPELGVSFTEMDRVLRFEFCNAADDCAVMDISVVNGVVSYAYVAAWDGTRHAYPSQWSDYPLGQRFSPFSGGLEGARYFGEWVGRKGGGGFRMFGANCRVYIVSCARMEQPDGRVYNIGCRLDCE